MKNRGQRSWSVGLSIADITNSILTDKKKTHAVSTLAQVPALTVNIGYICMRCCCIVLLNMWLSCLQRFSIFQVTAALTAKFKKKKKKSVLVLWSHLLYKRHL